MSSRIAVCGQHPVSTATIRSVGSTPAAERLSASSVVKMSLVTTASDSSSRSSWQSAARASSCRCRPGPPMPIRSGRSPAAARCSACRCGTGRVRRIVRDVVRWPGSRCGRVPWTCSLCQATNSGRPARVVLGEDLGERAAERREVGGAAVDQPPHRRGRLDRGGRGPAARALRSGRGRGAGRPTTSPPRRDGAAQRRGVARRPAGGRDHHTEHDRLVGPADVADEASSPRSARCGRPRGASGARAARLVVAAGTAPCMRASYRVELDRERVEVPARARCGAANAASTSPVVDSRPCR